MALDPSIVFRGTIPQIPDVGARLARGAQAQGIFQNMRNEAAMAPVRQQIAEQQAAIQGIQLNEALAGQQAANQQRDITNIATNYELHKRNLTAGNYEQVASELESYVERQRTAGQTDADLSDTLNAIEVLRSNDAGAITALIDAGKSAVDYAKGRGWIGKKGELVERFSPSTTTLPDGTTIQLSSTGRLRVMDAAGNELTGQAAIGAIKEAEEFGARTQGKRAGLRVRAQKLEDQRQDFVRQSLAARGLMKDTKRLLGLNELISTGKTAKARKAFGDMFNVTDPNLGEFNAKAGQLVLGQIRLLGANPTEGERAFLSEITPSLEQGGAVNEALLKDILEVQKRQVERGKWLAKNPEKTVEDYLLETETDDFTPQSSIESPPADTMPRRRRFNPATGRIE